jgi:hypothetical protein
LALIDKPTLEADAAAVFAANFFLAAASPNNLISNLSKEDVTNLFLPSKLLTALV